MDDSAIKARIKARREALGISQEEMAERLGIARNTLANIEKPLDKKGSTRITNEHLPDIARELLTSEEELFIGFRPCHPADKDTIEEAREGYLAREKSIKDDYEDRLAASRELIDALKNNIADLKKLLDEKEQQIAMLKKRRKS